MQRQYPRGPNPFGQTYASQGAVFQAGLQAGFTGNVLAPLAKGAVSKFFAPIQESHCIAQYRDGLTDGGTVNVAVWINTVFSWALRYNIPAFPGMPVNDRLVPVSLLKKSAGVYYVEKIPQGGGTNTYSGVGPTKLS